MNTFSISPVNLNVIKIFFLTKLKMKFFTIKIPKNAEEKKRKQIRHGPLDLTCAFKGWLAQPEQRLQLNFVFDFYMWERKSLLVFSYESVFSSSVVNSVLDGVRILCTALVQCCPFVRMCAKEVCNNTNNNNNRTNEKKTSFARKREKKKTMTQPHVQSRADESEKCAQHGKNSSKMQYIEIFLKPYNLDKHILYGRVFDTVNMARRFCFAYFCLNKNIAWGGHTRCKWTMNCCRLCNEKKKMFTKQ